MTDIINRQAAIKHLKKRLFETAMNNMDVITSCDNICEEIAENRIEPWLNELPSAKTQGHWIIAEDIGDCCYRCSKCGYIRDAYILDIGNYCPNCGNRNEEIV